VGSGGARSGDDGGAAGLRHAIGERSARRIERRCHEDVAVRVITANQAPDHTTVAPFRQRHETSLSALFGEVLELCADAGLVQVEVIAVDGTKVHANASQHANRDYERIAREILEEAGRIDAEQDERLGDRRGDELPPELSTSQGRWGGCATPSAGWMSDAPKRHGRSRPYARRGSRKPTGALRKSCGPSARPTRPMRPTEPAAG
jgi:hypothetical protein